MGEGYGVEGKTVGGVGSVGWSEYRARESLGWYHWD